MEKTDPSERNPATTPIWCLLQKATDTGLWLLPHAKLSRDEGRRRQRSGQAQGINVLAPFPPLVLIAPNF